MYLYLLGPVDLALGTHPKHNVATVVSYTMRKLTCSIQLLLWMPIQASGVTPQAEHHGSEYKEQMKDGFFGALKINI